MGADQLALIAAIASAVAAIAVSLRKRKDVDINEILARSKALEKRVETLEVTVETLQSELVEAEHDRFLLRRTLAKHGISDPTEKDQA